MDGVLFFKISTKLLWADPSGHFVSIEKDTVALYYAL